MNGLNILRYKIVRHEQGATMEEIEKEVEKMKKIMMCSKCSARPSEYECSCKINTYCSKMCQERDWDNHKTLHEYVIKSENIVENKKN